ncbi:hypothetical protein BCR43DRAFT_433118 [Syncephalastrum racemosum]|uniref:Anticodon-binding domain-containing protein n=1 Tax=Syncephalastrum racemosum TaxID=13706 RepID=A0A1X2HLX6_SYNRA|nr:hypothetical protein BCR43DRAFT_433118 [Syncephalastrum racemosum]
MKDLYTFDATADDAFASYDSVSGAYRRIFERLGVRFVVAEADSGNMGGSRSHEYHILSSAGEDTLLTCSKCDYAANQELAVGTISPDAANTALPTEQDQKMSQMLNLSGAFSPSLFSFVVRDVNGEATRQGTVAAVVPAGRSANMTKVTSELSKYLDLDAQEVLDLRATRTAQDNVTLFCDEAIPQGQQVHLRGSFRDTVEGDGCHACGAELKQVRAIEAAHTFYLGTKYSDALGCRYGPERKAAEMGCYGIGISRLLAAVAEVRHDQKGIVWPASIAPYRVCIIPTNDKQAEFASLTHTIYDTLNGTNSMTDEIIIDDRKGGFGRKMKDAELIGYPFTIVVGQKAFTEGVVEVHARKQGANSSIFSVPISTLDTFLQKSC